MSTLQTQELAGEYVSSPEVRHLDGLLVIHDPLEPPQFAYYGLNHTQVIWLMFN
jgi:hypothetical protein